MFKAYPNPVHSGSEVTIEINAPGKAILKLLDVHGKEMNVILDQVLGNNGIKKTISLGNCPKGMYFLELSLNKKIVHRKILAY